MGADAGIRVEQKIGGGREESRKERLRQIADSLGSIEKFSGQINKDIKYIKEQTDKFLAAVDSGENEKAKELIEGVHVYIKKIIKTQYGKDAPYSLSNLSNAISDLSPAAIEFYETGFACLLGFLERLNKELKI